MAQTCHPFDFPCMLPLFCIVSNSKGQHCTWTRKTYRDSGNLLLLEAHCLKSSYCIAMVSVACHDIVRGLIACGLEVLLSASLGRLPHHGVLSVTAWSPRTKYAEAMTRCYIRYIFVYMRSSLLAALRVLGAHDGRCWIGMRPYQVLFSNWLLVRHQSQHRRSLFYL
jgi:hypothetical protein